MTPKFNHCFSLVFFIALLLPFYSFSQTSDALFTKLTLDEANLNAEQLLWLQRMQENSSYESVTLVKMGDIKLLQENRVLTFTIPDREGVLVAKAKRIEASSDDNFYWYGEIQGNINDYVYGYVTFISKDGALFGYINIHNDDSGGYEVHDLGEGKNVLIKYKNIPWSICECPVGNSYCLNQNRNTLFLKYNLTENSRVVVSVIDIGGRQLYNKSHGMREIGTHEIELDVSNYSRGVYFLVLETSKKIQRQKVFIR